MPVITIQKKARNRIGKGAIKKRGGLMATRQLQKNSRLKGKEANRGREGGGAEKSLEEALC